MGNYAVRIGFDDGHDSGLYSWAYLHQLGAEKDRIWAEYLAAASRHERGCRRGPPAPSGIPPQMRSVAAAAARPAHGGGEGPGQGPLHGFLPRGADRLLAVVLRCSWRRPSSSSIWSSPCLYVIDRGGIVNARPGSFADAFFFSVQTLGTLGYGVMAPRTLYTNLLVTVESFTGILTIALFTGIIFARFSRPFARVVFSKVAVVAPFDGVPTLMFRTANQRGEAILDASVVVTLARQHTTLRRRHHAPLPGIEADALQQFAVRAVLDGDASDRPGQPALRPEPEDMTDRTWRSW